MKKGSFYPILIVFATALLFLFPSVAEAGMLILRPNGAESTGLLSASPYPEHWKDVADVTMYSEDESWQSLAFDHQSQVGISYWAAGQSPSYAGTYYADSYQLEDPPASVRTAAIVSVSVNAWVQSAMTGAGNYYKLSLKTLIPGATQQMTSESQLPAGVWTPASADWTKNPFTNKDWTWDEIDSLMAGIQLKSLDNNGIIISSQVWVEVHYTDPGPVAPIVYATFPTDITDTQATLNGYLGDLGGASSVNVSFEWGTTTSYGYTTPVQVMNAPGPFSAALNDLSAHLTYHFRAVAKNSKGTTYGSGLSFNTLFKPPGPPPVGTTGTCLAINRQPGDGRPYQAVLSYFDSGVSCFSPSLDDFCYSTCKTLGYQFGGYPTECGLTGSSYCWDWFEGVFFECRVGSYTAQRDECDEAGNCWIINYTAYKVIKMCEKIDYRGYQADMGWTKCYCANQEFVSVPTVATAIVTADVDIERNTATLKGNVVSTGGDKPSHRYIEWGTNDQPYGYTVTVTGTDGTSKRNTAYKLAVNPPAIFSLSLSPDSGTVKQGKTITSTATISLESGATQTVSLFASGAPAGATVTFSSTSCSPTCASTMTISTSSSTPGGVYSIAVTGTSSSGTWVATYTLTVASTDAAVNPYFSISLTPTKATSWIGQTPSSTVTIAHLSGTAEQVSLSASGLPSGAAAAFNPASCTPYEYDPETGSGPCYSTMTISTSSSTPGGVYSIAVTGTSSSGTAVATYNLTLHPGFFISLSPNTGKVDQGGSTTSNVIITSAMSIQPVSLSASGLPSGATAKFVPASCKPTYIEYEDWIDDIPCTSTMTISTSSSTPGGVYPITVTGISDTGTMTATYNLTVAGFDFSLSAIPASGTVKQGKTIDATVIATHLSGTGLPVSLSASGLPSGAAAAFSPASCTPQPGSPCSFTMTVATPQDVPNDIFKYTNTIDLGAGGTGEFSTTIPIVPGTLYRYRARVTNIAGEGVGLDRYLVIYDVSGNETQFTSSLDLEPLCDPDDDFTSTCQYLALYGDLSYLNIKWNARYYGEVEDRNIGIDCYLNCPDPGSNITTNCAAYKNSANYCSYMDSTGRGMCTIVGPGYLFRNQVNNITCRFYDPTNPTVEYLPYPNRTFKPVDFDVSSILNGSATVGKLLLLSIDVKNFGLLRDNFTSSISALIKPQLVYIGNPISRTGNLTYSQIGRMYPKLTFLSAEKINFKVLTRSHMDPITCNVSGDCSYLGADSECVNSKCWKRATVEIDAGMFSLPEFGWSGLLQIIILSVVVLLL